MNDGATNAITTNADSAAHICSVIFLDITFSPLFYVDRFVVAKKYEFEKKKVNIEF